MAKHKWLDRFEKIWRGPVGTCATIVLNSSLIVLLSWNIYSDYQAGKLRSDMYKLEERIQQLEKILGKTN